MPVIVIANHKGGVGKTTITAALAAEYAMRGTPVVAVDLDPQGNLTRRMGYMGDLAAQLRGRPNMASALAVGAEHAAEFARALIPCQWDPPWAEHIRLAAGHPDLETRALEAGQVGAHKRLRKALSGLDPATVVIIDTPPSMGHLMVLAAIAADHVLVVTHTEYDSVQGALKMQSWLEQYRDDLDLTCRLGGVIVNNRRARYNVHAVRAEDLATRFGDLLWEPQIPQRAVIGETQERAEPPQLGDKAMAKVFAALGDRAATMLGGVAA